MNNQDIQPLSTVMFDRIEAAVRDSRCPEAIIFLLQFFPSVGNDQNRLVQVLAAVGDKFAQRHDWMDAERYFRLSVSLHQKCLPDAHEGVIYSTRRLCDMLRHQMKWQELDEVLGESSFIIHRVARAMLKKRG